MRGQLGTKASSADVNATVLLHTPFSSAGFFRSMSTYPLDYHVAPVSGQYVGWNLTLSTSVASVSGTMVTQLTLAKANWCGCTGTSGDLIFNGGGGSGAAGNYTIVSGILSTVTLTSGGRGYTSVPTVALGGPGCSSALDLITATIGAGGVGCVQGFGTLLFSGIDGSGASGTYTALGGRITSLSLTSGGGFYTYIPTVTVSDTGCTGYSIEAKLSDPKLAGHSRRVTRVVTSSLYDGGLVMGVHVPFLTMPTISTFYKLTPILSCNSALSPTTSVSGKV